MCSQGEQAVIAGAYGYRLYKNGVCDPDRRRLVSALDAARCARTNRRARSISRACRSTRAYGQTLQTLNTLCRRCSSASATASGRRPRAAGRSGIWGRMRSHPLAARSRRLDQPAATSISTAGSSRSASTRRSASAATGTLVAGRHRPLWQGRCAASRSMFGNGSDQDQGLRRRRDADLVQPAAASMPMPRRSSTWFDSELKSRGARHARRRQQRLGRGVQPRGRQARVAGGGLSVTPQIQMVYRRSSSTRSPIRTARVVSSDQRRQPQDPLGHLARSSEQWERTATRAEPPLRRRQSELRMARRDRRRRLGHADPRAERPPVGRARRSAAATAGLGDRFTLYTEVSANTAIHDFGDSYSSRATAGFRLRSESAS